MNTDRYQGYCLVSAEGWRNMDRYDEMEPHVRRRLARSPFNLCPACVAMHADMVSMIEWMENEIRHGGEYA